VIGRIMKLKNSNDIIGNRIVDLPFFPSVIALWADDGVNI